LKGRREQINGIPWIYNLVKKRSCFSFSILELGKNFGIRPANIGFWDSGNGVQHDEYKEYDNTIKSNFQVSKR
jgi:hypothetical protein